jgi:hypothetical protein
MVVLFLFRCQPQRVNQRGDSLDILFARSSSFREESPHNSVENEDLNEWDQMDGSKSPRAKSTKLFRDMISSSESFPLSRVCDSDLLLSILDELRMPYGTRSRESIVDTEGRDKPLVWERTLGQRRFAEEGRALFSIVKTPWCFADLTTGGVGGVLVPQFPQKEAPNNNKGG